jgi:ectoine hydroxylase-related dioxygenase (phytanoyl-CoA dioxygenase family)
MKFTSDQIDVYRRNGVVPIGNVLDEATVAEAKEHIEALRQRDLLDNPAESLGKKAFRLIMVSSFDEWFKSIVNNDNLLDAAESVLGPNVQYYQDNIFWKPPKQGAPSTWHQDNIWWAADPPNMATIWIALDDADASNGGVHYIPGSQTNLLEGELDLDDPKAYSHKLLSDDQVDASRAISFTVPAGHAVMHHCQTIHGAPPNRSDRSRCGYTVHLQEAGLRGQDVTQCPILRGKMP